MPLTIITERSTSIVTEGGIEEVAGGDTGDGAHAFQEEAADDTHTASDGAGGLRHKAISAIITTPTQTAKNLDRRVANRSTNTTASSFASIPQRRHLLVGDSSPELQIPKFSTKI